MNTYDFKILADKVKVPIQKLSAETIAKVNGAPQAQKRTATYKKAVYIVEDLVFKGPYVSDKDHLRLMKNLRYTYAIQQLEEALHLPGWKRGALPWKFIGLWGVHQYYLVTPNVGKWKNIPIKPESSPIETDVPVVPRCGAVRRVSDVENNGRLTDDIKLAVLQHLYFRFLLDIGDSGTHNILIREDHDRTGRLIAGIDLEERRGIRAKRRRLDHLFKKKNASKDQERIYKSDINRINSLSYSQLDQHTLESLCAVGIDLERLKGNMELWNKLN
jgi:hypothetical protein